MVKVNEFKFVEELGFTSNHPRSAIAYKFDAPIGTTTLEKIEVQVGRTGVLTPVALLSPVFLGGVTVTSASLHNEDEIRRLDVREGDEVEIIRSGDVIPKVIGVKKDARGRKKLTSFEMPLRCPSCDSKVISEEGLVGRRCPNRASCPAQIEGRLIHFASKDALNMEGVGPQWIAQFIAKGWLKNPSDFYSITESQLMTLDRMGEKLAKKLVSSIQNRKKTSLERVIYGLGIPHVGETLAEKIAKNIGDLSALLEISTEDLTKIEDVGLTVAESIGQFCREQRNEILRLIKILEIEKLQTAGAWSGLTFVLTGSLQSMTRSQAEAKIKERGGSSGSSVTKNTFAVIVGEDAGSKLEKAKKFGIQLWDEKQFIEKLKF